jgi:hypothetical protein
MLPQGRYVNDDFSDSEFGSSDFSNNGLSHDGVDVSWFPAW